MADYIANGTVKYIWWKYSHAYYDKLTADQKLPPKWVLHLTLMSACPPCQLPLTGLTRTAALLQDHQCAEGDAHALPKHARAPASVFGCVIAWLCGLLLCGMLTMRHAAAACQLFPHHMCGALAGLLDSDEVSSLRLDERASCCSIAVPAAQCIKKSASERLSLSLQFLIITDGSPSVPDQLRRMMAWETIGGVAIFWRWGCGCPWTDSTLTAQSAVALTRLSGILLKPLTLSCAGYSAAPGGKPARQRAY